MMGRKRILAILLSLIMATALVFNCPYGIMMTVQAEETQPETQEEVQPETQPGMQPEAAISPASESETDEQTFDKEIILPVSQGYRFYGDAECTFSIDDEEIPWTEAMTLFVKPENNCRITGITVTEIDDNESGTYADTATESECGEEDALATVSSASVSETSDIASDETAAAPATPSCCTVIAPAADAEEKVWTLEFAQPRRDSPSLMVDIRSAAVMMMLKAADPRIYLDLANGNITFTDTQYTYYDSEGTRHSEAHSESNIYVIRQGIPENPSDYDNDGRNKSATTNCIKVGTTAAPVAKDFDIFLDGVKIDESSSNKTPQCLYVNNGTGSTVNLVLADGSYNWMKKFSQESKSNPVSTDSLACLEKEVGTSGILRITCEEGYASIDGCHECEEDNCCGTLYAEVTCDSAFTSNAYCLGAVIGSKGSYETYSAGADAMGFGNRKSLENLFISGGNITAVAGHDDNDGIGGASIGVGSTHLSTYTGYNAKNLRIEGGRIRAIRGAGGSAGIGGGYHAGFIQIFITGGYVDATEISVIDRNGFVPRCPGIGAGCGGTQTGSYAGAEVNISGGEVHATGSIGAAIGGSGAGAGGAATPCIVNITGGDIYAETKSYLNYGGFGAAIGTGGSIGAGNGGDATINISGDCHIETESEKGADIGGGGTSTGNGGKATVTISGGDILSKNGGIGGGNAIDSGTGGAATVTVSGGTVKASSVGGGSSKDGNGGTAALSISGTADVSITGSIGGGETRSSNISHQGGNAGLTVTNGILKVAGNIGGGNATSSAKGGNATITVSGGELYCASIGGGKSGTGTPGALTSTTGAGVKISGGVVKAGKIGGGTNNSGIIGKATAEITGGNIQGQFILSNTSSSASDHCYFIMSGDSVIDNTMLGQSETVDDITISYQRGPEEGGAIYMNDANGTVDIMGGTIQNASGTNGGAVYMTSGSFTMSQSDPSSPTVIQGCEAVRSSSETGFGGAVYLGGGTVTINGGSIGITALPNKAADGAGIYLPAGTFTMNDGYLVGNHASHNGGGLYLAMTPLLNGGSIISNTADLDGGGIYIEKTKVELDLGGDVTVKGNHAADGAGLYINGTAGATIPDAGFSIAASSVGNISFTENTATGSGGAVCVNNGYFRQNTEKIIIKENAAANGGGIAVLDGNYELSAGSLEGNTATVNGGGFYISGGDFTMTGGNIIRNTAAGSGGGGYVGGNFAMTAGTIGGDGNTNTAANGGGFSVNDGTVIMYGGNVDYNTATGNGGGMFISAAAENALVDILSGSISSNTAVNGAGMAVVSNSETSEIDIVVGVNTHHSFDTDGKLIPFAYDGLELGEEHQGHDHSGHSHESCPVVKNNTASGMGGGFFLDSKTSRLTFYCVEESNNTAAGSPQCWNMDVEGGKVEIGDKTYQPLESDEKAKGNITMSSSILVEGGTVDVYGEMTNPQFTKDITVDVKKDEDYYEDHRLEEEKDPENPDSKDQEFKVHFYENFKNPGGTVTGQYIAKQYHYEDKYPADGPDDDPQTKHYAVTIQGSLFAHPGYKIIGWNIKQEPTILDEGVWYTVGDTYDLSKLKSTEINVDEIGAGESKTYINEETGMSSKISKSRTTPPAYYSDNRLVIYAIWERCGYKIEYLPNAVSYTGSMEDQICMVGDDVVLAASGYTNPGYFFTGWNTRPDGSGTFYEALSTVEGGLTDEDGTVVKLYAQWTICEHRKTDEHGTVLYDYLVYTADGNKATESCAQCGGHTATVTINAVNAEYDSNAHLATVSYSSGWLGEKPGAGYDMDPSPRWDSDGLRQAFYYNAGGSLIPAEDRKPVHAGTYTASVKLTNGKDAQPLSASVSKKYLISRIKWPTPEVPKIVLRPGIVSGGVRGKPYVEITEPLGDSMRYAYQMDDGDISEYGTGHTFTELEYGHYYYFYDKLTEDRDHMESEPNNSESYLHTGGNIVTVENQDGIVVNTHIDDNAYRIDVKAGTGFHFRNYEQAFSKDYQRDEHGDRIPEATGLEYLSITSVTAAEGYSYSYEVSGLNLATYCTAAIELTGVAADASVIAETIEKQVFSDFNGHDTSISRDSAFTVKYNVKNYIPEEYSGQSLQFSQEVPENTVLILRDSDGVFWYYMTGSKESQINLKDFTKMGGTGTFSFDTYSTEKTDFKYQVIVDFSQVKEEDRIPGNEISINLKLTPSSGSAAPQIPSSGEIQASVSLHNAAEFTLNSTAGRSEKNAGLTAQYTASAGAASIWDGRYAAIVLTPDEGSSSIPEDLVLSVKNGELTTIYSMNQDGRFVIPLSGIADESLDITVQSSLFTKDEAVYTFSADWMISESHADTSPLNGITVASSSLTFSGKRDPAVSIKAVNGKTTYHSTDLLDLGICWKAVPVSYKIEAVLYGKTGGSYIGTGKTVTIKNTTVDMPETTPYMLEEFKLEGFEGSYRLTISVSDAGKTIASEPFYFIVK